MSDKGYKSTWKTNINLPGAYKVETNLLKKSRSINKYQPLHSLEWTESIQERLRDFFLRCSYPYRKTYLPPIGEDLMPHVHRFFISLDAYIESIHPVIPEKEILFGATQLDFATYLKRVRTKAFISTTDGILLDTPEWWNEIPTYTIHDIGDIFNYQYLIHYNEVVNDYEYGKIPVKIQKSSIKKFKKALQALLPDELPCPIIDPKEILISNSGSSALKKNSVKTERSFLLKQRENSFNKERKPAKRCIIQVAPAGARDTCINTINDINTIKLIEYQTAILLEREFKEFIVDKNLEDFDIKYRKFQNSYKYFLCRDIKKEGITKPRELLTAMLEVLHEKYPEVPGWDFCDFYKNYDLIIDNETISLERGHGLGMANSLTTLMQIVLFYRTLEEVESQTCQPGMLTHNDDIIFGFKKSSDLEEFWSTEEGILEELSILRNPQKSFRARRAGVFIEKYFYEYRSTISRKESYQRRELLLALTANNIVHAKQMVSSLVYIEDEIILFNFPEVLSYWGYEFWKDEHLYPALCGGWFNRSIYGISLDLKVLDDLPFNDKVEKAYEACKNNRVYPKFEKGLYDSPLSKLYPMHLNLIEEKHQLTYDIGYINDINRNYNRLKYQPWSYEMAWNILLKQRSQTFIKHDSYRSFKDFIKDVVNENNKDYLPLDFMIKSQIPGKIVIGNVDDIYHSDNPKLAYLSSLHEIPGIYPNRYSINFCNIDSVQHRITADQRKRLNSFVGILSLTSKMRKDTYLLPKENFEEFFECYRTPLRLFKVYGELECVLLPLLKEEYRPKILQDKKSIFSRFLSEEEYFLLYPYRDKPKFIKKIIDLKIKDYDSFFEEFDILKNIPKSSESEESFSESEEETPVNEVKKFSLTKENYDLFKNGNLEIPDYHPVKNIFNGIKKAIDGWYITLKAFEETPENIEEIKTEYIESLDRIIQIYTKQFFFDQEESQSSEEVDEGGFDFDFL